GDWPHQGLHNGPGSDRTDPISHLRGRILRDADLRPGSPEADRRRPRELRGGPESREPPAGLPPDGPGPGTRHGTL
ncbi:MAG: hypothetical protein AVDCRST_MAG28-1364, partial [uncultured Rubrobacteraceae bacterium]